jgi:MFS family permease
VIGGADPSGVRVLAATAAVTTVCVFPAFLTGAMAVQLREDLGFSEAGTGFGVAAFFAAAAVSSAALGRLTERVGPALGLRAAAVITAVGQCSIALLARSLGSLLVLLAVTGSANALAQPAANLLIARHLPPNRQGIAFAVKQSAIPVSTLLAGIAVPTIALTVGWKWAFAGASVVALFAAASVPNLPEPARDLTAPRMRPRADVPTATMAVLAIGIALGAAAAGTLGAFLVSAGVDAGFSDGVAALTLSAGSAIGVAVRLLAGVRADRRDGGHLRVVALMLAGGAVAYALLATGDRTIFLLATPLAFGAGWAWPGLFNLAIVRANPSSPAAATGVTQTGTYIGAVAGPLLFGLLADRGSYGIAWLAASAVALAASVAITAGRALLRRDRLAAIESFPTELDQADARRR